MSKEEIGGLPCCRLSDDIGLKVDASKENMLLKPGHTLVMISSMLSPHA
jgi:hypothetical protein